MDKQKRIAELKARIARAEDRATRCTTIQDYLTDLQIIQKSQEEIRTISE